MFRVDLGAAAARSARRCAAWRCSREYLQVQGREWERFAPAEDRVMRRASVASGRALALRSTVTPFVYRRYLDYGVFEGLRQPLHPQGPRRGARRAAGQPERANDVKLSRGGIREIEFIVQ